MENLFEFLIDKSGPLIYGLGLISAWVMFLFGKRILDRLVPPDPGEGEPRGHKRRDDELMSRFLEAFEKSADAQAKIAQALHDNGNRLEKMGEAFLSFADEIRTLVGDIHRRIDGLYKNHRE